MSPGSLQGGAVPIAGPQNGCWAGPIETWVGGYILAKVYFRGYSI